MDLTLIILHTRLHLRVQAEIPSQIRAAVYVRNWDKDFDLTVTSLIFHMSILSRIMFTRLMVSNWFWHAASFLLLYSREYDFVTP